MSKTSNPDDVPHLTLDAIDEILLTPEQEAHLAEILHRPYHREIMLGEDGRWYATVAEWFGCMGDGATSAEALTDLDAAMEVWAASCIAAGTPVPEPIRASEFSGKLTLRIPSSLHQAAARLAHIEGLSLNNFLSIAIARAVGRYDHAA